jgi:hypothetical protein
MCHNPYRSLVDHLTWYVMYQNGWRKPNHPVPAIPLSVKYDFIGCVNIDDVRDPDIPIIVYMWDSWTKREVR